MTTGDTNRISGKRVSEDVDYGVDAPALVRFFFVAGAFAVVLFIVVDTFLGSTGWSSLAVRTDSVSAAL